MWRPQPSLRRNRPVQSFETQYLKTNYFTFRSIFGRKIDLRNHLGDIKAFDFIFDFIEIWGHLIDLVFDLLKFLT